jgi:hypothetical protein
MGAGSVILVAVLLILLILALVLTLKDIKNKNELANEKFRIYKNNY